MGKKRGRQPVLFFISKSILGVDIIQQKRGFWGFLGVFGGGTCVDLRRLGGSKRGVLGGGYGGGKKGVFGHFWPFLRFLRENRKISI